MTSKKHNIEILKSTLLPIISDETASLSILRDVYGDVGSVFLEYQGQSLTRTGLMAKWFNVCPTALSSRRQAHSDLFLKLGCMREESQGLRGLLLKSYKSHTVVWGMNPRAVVCLLLNLSSDFNNLLGLLLDVELPPAISLGLLEDMLEQNTQ
jgi:hypothetical protein